MPARIEQAQTVLRRQYEANVGSLRKMGQKAYSYEHAYRVAWRNIVDWVEAQMALVEGITPTGRRIDVTGIELFRLVDSRIVEDQVAEDILGILQQMGVNPLTRDQRME